MAITEFTRTNLIGLVKAGGENLILGAAGGIGMIVGVTIASAIAERIVDPEGYEQKKALRKARKEAKKASKELKKAAKKAAIVNLDDEEDSEEE